ncbi:DNA primase family protein [[Mycobacterium] zoologicum]|uniref:DNA primase family protein n=1 Tax=[Mycobacterium] zoologicum TaxID=2872311 RepID=UPI001CDACB28|nr:DNA primase family protein [Mycolicibacter sp. MYC101]MEB3062476.1 phage/plasmid primase, P4 family [Mycolicibacter sp. MYC101]
MTAASEQHSGQVRMAHRLAHVYRDRLLHVHGIGWHHFGGTRWVYDDTGAAKRAVLDILRTALADSLQDKQLRTDVRKCESASGVNGVLDIAAALKAFAATTRDLDADPYLLNVANGTLDLRTLELRDHHPGDGITKVTRAAWRPDAVGDVWAAHIGLVLPDESVRAYLQRLVGLSLLGTVREHVLPILTGTGGNGKGVTYGALLHALGDYASTVEPDLFMHRDGAHPTGEMDLLGRRLVIVSESERDRRLAEATMKRLTGGDTIRARRMRQDFVEFAPSHLPLLITNHLPRVSGDDPAIWRRIRIIPFDVTVTDEQRRKSAGIEEHLQGEADAILSWAIAGWADYQARRGLDEPASVLAATDAYHRNSDAVGQFITECCSTAPTLKAETKQLFERWERWRSTEGVELLSMRAFGIALDNKGYTAQKSTGGRRFRNGIGLLANPGGAE